MFVTTLVAGFIIGFVVGCMLTAIVALYVGDESMF